MDFLTFMKKFNKMCILVEECRNCPFNDQDCEFTCREWIFDHPQEALNILQDWCNTHKTNYEKFTETFSHTFKNPENVCEEMFNICSPYTSNPLEYKATYNQSWWDELYIEPKDCENEE